MLLHRQFQAFILQHVPTANLTREGTGYADEGVHTAWIGFLAVRRSLPRKSTNTKEPNRVL